ncbi:MAG: EamA family transporter [Thermaerobacter sp.]|nr:EamA family transporter [Thermaerobacter sp.]
MPDRTTLAYVGATLLFWSSAFAGIRSALIGVTPGHVLLLRFGIASLVLLGWSRVVRLPWPPVRLWGRVAMIGIVGISVYQGCLTFGEQVVPAGTASFIVAAAPVFTALLAALWLSERLSRRTLAGLGVSLTGVGLISFGSGTVGFHQSALLIVVAAVATAVFFVAQKPLLGQYPPLAVTAWVTWAGTLPLLVFLPGLAANVAHAPPASLWSVAYLGVLPAAVAYVLWAHALQRAPAGQVTSWLYLNPFLATAIGWLWLGEVPTWTALAGGVVAVGGVVLVNWRPRRSVATATTRS